MLPKSYITLFACLLFYTVTVQAQGNPVTDTLHSVEAFDSKTISGLQNQYSKLESKLDKQSAKLLSKMQHKENKLYKKLNATGSAKAQQLFTDDITKQYKDLQTNLSQTTDKFKRFPLKEYIPGIDSVQTSLSFLMKGPGLPMDKLEQLQSLNTKLKDLQGELQKANDIQAFVRERESVLKEQLMNTGLAKQLTSINKQAYYYEAQLSEYKSLLNDKEKLEEKLLATVQALPAFQKFWQKNSYLAALFPIPANYSTAQALAGLQSRASVQIAINQRIGVPFNSLPSGGIGGDYFQQSIDAAQAQLNKLKDKFHKFSNGSGSSNMTMPEFKPNDQRIKPFLKRLEYGFNVQNEASRYSLPAMSDLALTLGYKLSDNKRLGIGASYKIGWGSGFKDIHISSEGAGLRSYVDIKAPFKSKGSLLTGLWLSGGFEYNYLSSFGSIQELHENIDVWQQSALLGISKKYKVGKKEGNMQLLYDFLHNKQTPTSTALKFRLGYNF